MDRVCCFSAFCWSLRLRIVRPDAHHKVEPFTITLAVEGDIQGDDSHTEMRIGRGFEANGEGTARLSREFAFEKRRLRHEVRRGVNFNMMGLFAGTEVPHVDFYRFGLSRL